MNIKTLAEEAYSIITGGKENTDNKTSMQEVREHVRQACNTFMVAHLKSINKTKDPNRFVVPREWLKKVNLTVTEKVAVLTERPLKLPGNKTLYQVEVAGEECEIKGELMVPINKPIGMYNQMESSSLNDFYRYQINRFEDGIQIKIISDAIAEIDVYFVESASSIDVKKELNIPEELENDIIMQVIKTLAPQVDIPEDIKQDNVD